MRPEDFYFGVHQPNWLWHPDNQGLVMFPSYSTLHRRKTPFPRATVPYAVDSGGFSELQKHGRWTISPQTYVAFLRRLWEELGPFRWAAQQDWMCEQQIREGGWYQNGVRLLSLQHRNPRSRAPVYFAGTGLSVAEHQDRSDRNYHQLRELAPELPILYVLQGQHVDDYLRHRDLAAARGTDLSTHPVVGVGSVCRRQATGEAEQILARLHTEGLTRLHGFGFKIDGILRSGRYLASADSQSGSLTGRWWKGTGTACGTVHPSHRGRPPAKSCANCTTFLFGRHRRIQRRIACQPDQLDLFTLAPAEPHRSANDAAARGRVAA
ncbi:hypothetical protein M8C13_36215 [Crossiella sp. SN42]|uniref:deazapurine DNA modification protein DpdA family protein n=1 Tax=Crossiella sp. SN42 TaxID=2944808 RepID=UPI00207D0301|nr:hypothetical protein [Crossiella sp. SN42]MCO1581209.1 hypothetical protein [Crossiella sp. SN42]